MRQYNEPYIAYVHGISRMTLSDTRTHSPPPPVPPDYLGDGSLRVPMG